MSCTFVPPYLIEQLAASDDPAVRVPGRRTLVADSTFRRRRLDRGPGSGRSPVARVPLGPETAPTGKRLVHDVQGGEQLPGVPVRDDDDPATGDPAVDEAHASSGLAHDLFADVFGRRSYDGQGATALVSVHYGQNYDNAFWDGSQLVFGDGDGRIFDRFTKPMDIMVHEYAHAVTQFSAALVYSGQSGALNESVSDVFAAMAKQKSLGQTVDQADWLIGEGLFLPGVNGRAIRSMIEPGTAYDDPQLGRDPQPASMADYIDTTEDNGGVHLNSGIPNRAFALAALAIGGSSWEAPGRVWFDTLTGGGITAEIDFAGFATATVESATRLFADDPSVATSVRQAWVTVGVLADGGEPVPAPAAEAGPANQPPEPGPAGPGPATEPTGRVAVRRTGGFTGLERSAEVDLAADPHGPEVASLLRRVNFAALPAAGSAPDRFVYTVSYSAPDIDDVEITLPEYDLTPELSQVVRIVLDR